MSHQKMLTISLFLIGSLHTLIFSIFQMPQNFLVGEHSVELILLCKFFLYLVAVIVSFCHQLLGRKLGLRKTLYLGLLCNLLGLTSVVLNQTFFPNQGSLLLMFLSMSFFGLSLASVLNCLVTYITIEYPKRLGMATIILFAFFNLGPLLAPILTAIFPIDGVYSLMYHFLWVLLAIAIWFVHRYFFDPPVSPDKIHMKKGTIIWKELHYRLAFFVIAIFFYGMVESSYDLWGHMEVNAKLGPVVAGEVIPIYWLFLIIGQVLLLAPLYFYPAKRILYFLIALIIFASYQFPLQESRSGFLLWAAIAGAGCSAVFPILIAQMELEILPFAIGNHRLPYLEKGISIMMGGYLAGIGVIDLWVERASQDPAPLFAFHFHWAALAVGITGILSLFLNLTAPSKLNH